MAENDHVIAFQYKYTTRVTVDPKIDFIDIHGVLQTDTLFLIITINVPS